MNNKLSNYCLIHYLYIGNFNLKKEVYNMLGDENEVATKKSEVLMIEGEMRGINVEADATTVFSLNHANQEAGAVDENGNPIPELYQINYDYAKGGNVTINPGVHLTVNSNFGTADAPIQVCVVHGTLTLPKGENTTVIKHLVTMPTGKVELPNDSFGFGTIYGSETSEVLALAAEFSNINLLAEIAEADASHIIGANAPLMDAPAEM